MDYITELKELRAGCEFENYTEDSAVIDQFIERCSSAKHLLGVADLTTDVLMTVARGEELSDKRAEVYIYKREPGPRST